MQHHFMIFFFLSAVWKLLDVYVYSTEDVWTTTTNRILKKHRSLRLAENSEYFW